MKKILLKSIGIYQVFFSIFIKNMFGIKSSCRFPMTCSSYAKSAIYEKGAIKGSYLALIRILKCQPFYKIA